jgi:hypothetical protein
MKIQYLKDINDVEIVLIVNEDGSTLSMSKKTYDEQQAASKPVE